MTIENRRQLENTLVKLRELEELCIQKAQAQSGDEHVRELTLHSIKKTINRFKEEIARFEAHARQGSHK